MSLLNDIRLILDNNLDSPSLLLNDDNEIMEFNGTAEDLFNNIVQFSKFIDLFDKGNSNLINRLLLEAKNFDRVVEQEIFIDNVKTIKKQFNFVLTPLTFENEKLFLATFMPIKGLKNTGNNVQFKISTLQADEFFKDKTILSIIEQIKSNFPFTFIAKGKLQKAVNQLAGFFWIKNDKGEYLIVNDKYSKLLGAKPAKIEGTSEAELLPGYYKKLFNLIDNYIISSGNIVSIKGITPTFQISGNESTEIIEFPLLDMDENVVAIIGLNRINEKNGNGSSTNLTVLKKAFSELKIPAIVVSFDEEILSYSELFREKMNFSKDTKITGLTLKQIFGDEISTLITNYKNDDNNKKELNFTFELRSRKKGLTKFDISVKKIFNGGIKPKTLLINFLETSKELEGKEMVEKTYDRLIKNNPEPIFIYEIENLKFIEVNDAALSLYGYTRDGFMRMDLTDLYAPEDIQTLIETSSGKTMTGAFTGPWRHKKHDGSFLLVEMSKVMFTYNGQPAHLNIIHDVTKQIENNKRLQLYKSSYEFTSDMMITTDKDGFILFNNDQVTQTLGYSKKDLQQSTFISLVSDNDRAIVNSDIFHSKSNTVKNLKFSIKKSNGNKVNVEMTASPIFNYKGEVESYNLIIKPEKEKADIGIEQEEKPYKKSVIDPSFLSNLFHELLTPINVIIGFGQDLAESIDKPSEEQKESIEIIKENQKLLMQTMDTAVEYSFLEQNLVELKPTKFSFVDIISELEKETAKIAKTNNIEIAYGKISSSLKLETDRQKFTSLVTHLLTFAIMITHEKKIFISAYPYQQDSCLISFKDKRKGITTDFLENLKEIFILDENLIRQKYGISRFSIRLVRKLMEVLNVKTQIVKHNDEITEFGILFPIEFLDKKEGVEKSEDLFSEEKQKKSKIDKRKLQPDEMKIVESKFPENELLFKNEGPPSKKTKIDLKKLSCLYVEDQPDSQLLFKVQMKDLKSIDFATSFEKALPLLKNKYFDFVLMDINLQGEYNGLDALRIIQKMPDLNKIPIIAVTAYVVPGAAEKFIKAGFSEFITKPILRDKLITALENVFNY